MNTSSYNYPNLFDVARNKVAVAQDLDSITSRVKLLLLTEPTELYMEPSFGVGLRKYIFQYNTDNVVAQIKDKLIEQLRLWEPCVVPEETTVERGLEYTGQIDMQDNLNILALTIKLKSIYGQSVTVDIYQNDFRTE